MFGYFANQRPQNTAQARTEREEASIRTLREAFGDMQPHREEHGMARQPEVMVADATMPVSHFAPLGHRLEEHHIFENCERGRRRGQGRDFPTPPHEDGHGIPSATGAVG